MSGGVACRCDDRRWVITAYRKNYSAFNGYHATRSRYSEVRCRSCHARWRTTAAYVETLVIEEEPEHA